MAEGRGAPSNWKKPEEVRLRAFHNGVRAKVKVGTLFLSSGVLQGLAFPLAAAGIR